MQQWDARRPPGSGLRWLRLVIVGLGLVLGLVLLARGNLLVGGLVTVLAALRLVMVVKLERRRRAFAARRRT
jgi:Flp pilus assembly protein TadB